MALDSNSPGDERSVSGGSERLGSAGLKLVGDRGAATGATGAAPSPGQAAGTFSDTKSFDTKGVDAKGIDGVRPAPVRRGARKQGRQLPLWLFMALLVLFLVGYGYQTHQASQFEAEVSRLEASLARAESRLESHRTHLLEIRGGVHDLSSRLESLRVLIDRDPTAPVESPAAADSTAPAQPGQPAQP
jgi:uncharacterized protein HemX